MSAASTACAAPARSTIDGKPARACLTLAVQIDGCELRTVEGLAPSPDRLGILQAAFKRNHALQCGFCTAGILMSLDSFLREHPQPDEEDIRDLLSGHLCRCTGYAPIVRAALEAAAELADQNQRENRCLTSEQALSPAWRAIPMRWRSSMTAFA